MGGDRPCNFAFDRDENGIALPSIGQLDAAKAEQPAALVMLAQYGDGGNSTTLALSIGCTCTCCLSLYEWWNCCSAHSEQESHAAHNSKEMALHSKLDLSERRVPPMLMYEKYSRQQRAYTHPKTLQGWNV